MVACCLYTVGSGCVLSSPALSRLTRPVVRVQGSWFIQPGLCLQALGPRVTEILKGTFRTSFEHFKAAAGRTAAVLQVSLRVSSREKLYKYTVGFLLYCTYCTYWYCQLQHAYVLICEKYVFWTVFSHTPLQACTAGDAISVAFCEKKNLSQGFAQLGSSSLQPRLHVASHYACKL